QQISALNESAADRFTVQSTLAHDLRGLLPQPGLFLLGLCAAASDGLLEEETLLAVHAWPLGPQVGRRLGGARTLGGHGNIGLMLRSSQVGPGPATWMPGLLGRCFGSCFQRADGRLNGPIIPRPVGR